MRTSKINPGNFPVILKIIDGYLVLSSAEFGLILKKRFDSFRKAEEIGNLYFDMIRKIDEEIAGRLRRKERIPEPKKLNQVLPVEASTVYSVREMSRVLSVSEDTIRRMADEGTLKCKLTRGGHRKFSAFELERARELSLSEELPKSPEIY